MVSVSEQNPEITRRTEGQTTPSAAAAPAKPDNNAGIFRVGLTSAQAQAEGLSSLFTKYNADGNDEISQSEFDAYTTETSNQQQDITSNSGKRVAAGGVYTVQSGDTLSKIAQDFGIKLLDLYEANKSVIGNDANKIQVGQKLRISAGQTSKNTDTTSVSTDDNSQTSAAKNKKHEKIIQMLKAFGIDVNNTETQELLAKFKTLPEEQKHAIMHDIMGQYIDFDKVDERFAGKSLDEIVQSFDIDMNEWAALDPKQKGEVLAKGMNQAFLADLDETNENSGYNKALQRLKTQGPTDKERELYGSKFDFDNLSEEDYKGLAKLSVAQGYVATIITVAHNNLQDGKNDDFIITAQSYMRSIFRDKVEGGLDIQNLMVFMASTKQQDNDSLRALLETHAETYKSTGQEMELFENAGFQAVIENLDENHIKMLYQNNSDAVDRLNDIVKTVANNTTDETRKAMLNNIAANSADIVKGNTPTSSAKPAPVSNGFSAPTVSNPIQNAVQTNYITDLKQASLEYQSQFNDNFNDSNSIPENFRSAFNTIQEYRDFKGTGMTMAEYQRAKSAIKNNFTSAMNTLIENYTNIPDKFKPRILAFFDSMDNNTSGELYLGANNKVRAFMDKYNYMTDEKLLNYIDIHPGCLTEAPREVQKMIKELQTEREEQS